MASVATRTRVRKASAPERVVTLETARRLAVTAQLLAGQRVPATADGILDIVRRLGRIQPDPTSALARSYLLVLWSRLGSYDPGDLDTLLWERRDLCEYRAYVVPTDEYPYYRARMRDFPAGDSKRSRDVHEWMAALFGFRFRLELYVPKAKREYGAFVLPILRGDRLVGRVDSGYDRRERRLRVHAVHWEPDAPRGARAPVKRALAGLEDWLRETRP